MAPKQKTFELIPDPVGPLGQGQQAGAVLSKPPMTTKQAKKLYRQKSKGPKLSKAEQRRIELMEQDHTISNFINRLGSGRKPGSNEGRSNLGTVLEAELETVTEAQPDTETEGGESHVEEDSEGEASEKENQEPNDVPGDRPAKRKRTTQPNEKLLDRMIHIPSQRSVDAVARVAQELGKGSWSRASSVDTDDPATETMLEDQLIADVELASSRSMASSSPIKGSPVKQVTPIHVPGPNPTSAAPAAPDQARPLPPRPLPGKQNLQPARLPTSHKPQTAKTAVSGHVRAHHGEGIFRKPTSPFVPTVRGKVAIESPAIGVPSAPPRFMAPAEPRTSSFAKPRFLPRHVQTPRPAPVQASPTYAGSRRSVTEASNALPTSTQLFVMNHAEELFPSASQEAKELLEDQAPAARPTTRSASPVRQSPKPPAAKFVVAPRLGTSSRHGPQFKSRQQRQPPRDGGPAPLEFPFLSTQDFVLSSQDMIELDTPSKVGDDYKPLTTRPFARKNDAPTTRQESAAPGRQHAFQLPVPTKSKAPALQSTTKPRMDHGHGAQTSTSASESGTGFEAHERTGEAKQGTGCPGRVRSPQGPQCVARSSERRSCFEPASRTAFSPQDSHAKAGSVDQGCGARQASEHTPFSCHSLSSANPSQTNRPLETKNAITTPRNSPPKKRMFGSSGPGAEVLVAMERSYRENLEEKRRREEELRAQAKKQQETEQLAKELADIIDDDELSDGWLREDTSLRQPTHAEGGTAGEGLHQTSSGKQNGKVELPVSQETDYGDFDLEAGEEELAILADMAWLDDDLDDF
ncbi:hypothetical protein VSDG_08386 [Cytospora chrysosperma]|uniref:Uncharacterized protein n=1 Tax=Cytospora chrysosperma TaxID=252740 RepID=A0A423VGF9_CYTCH|nr:hypothetical protein VSDG_08386 [Valsa sordida]